MKFWNMAPRESGQVLDVFIYGEIRSTAPLIGGRDVTTANKFLDDLAQFPEAQTINVRINSPGGSVFTAAAIRNQLMSQTAEVHTWCDGLCASAAVGILLAAKLPNRHMSSSTLLMIHNPSTSCAGTEKDFRDTADLLAKVKQTLINIYSSATGLSEQELSELMDKTTYLDAHGARNLRFVGDVVDAPVVYDFRDDGAVACEGQLLDVAAVAAVPGLREHLMKLTSGEVQNKIKGGFRDMTLEEFLALHPDARQTEVQNLLNLNGLNPRAQAALAGQTQLLRASEEKVTQLQQDVNSLQASLDEMRLELESAKEAAATNTVNTINTANTAEALLTTMPQEIQDMVAQARADAVAAQEALAAAQAAQAFAEFRETFAEFGNLPINDAHLGAMQTLSKQRPEMYAELRELLKVANTAMGAQMSPIGSERGQEVGTTAYAQLEQAIKAHQESNIGSTYAQAMRAVLVEQPELYNAYRDGMGAGN